MRLLVVGSLKGYMADAGRIAFQNGAAVVHRESIQEALESLRNGQGADIIFLDIELNVEEMIQSLARDRISLPVIVCGINVKSDLAADAIHCGAADYVPLPPDPEMIAAVLEAVSKDTKDVIFEDPSMKELLNMAARIAPSHASVLITGESGTGKEVVAHYIHKHSARASQKFISINCAAIPENLLESELFGHEKGAFTGAAHRRIGKFEEANGGTLLLDEISEMDPRLQAKLLRAIQEREIDRVGGSKPVKIDIRLIATSNRNLLEEVKKGTFREDLYFRLNVVNLHLHPLRKRPGDIRPLIDYFIQKYSALNRIDPPRLTSAAADVFLNYSWPGNVRELENAIHRAVLLSRDGEISPADIQQSAPDDVSGGLVGRTVSDVERELILGTLNHCLGNRTQAASILGISIRTLRNKLKLYTEENADSGGSDKLQAYHQRAI